MNATENKLTTLATELANAFEQQERNSGEKFYSLKHGSPQWMVDAIREAHGGIMPNDWIYEHCSRVADQMVDCDPEEWEDSIGEWADGLVDVYNADRTAWLASHLDFAAFVDDAVEELGHSGQGIFGDIGYGQYRCIEGIASELIRGVQAEADNSDDEESDD